MPLDAQTLRLIDRFAAMGGPPLEEMTVEEARRGELEYIELGGPPEPVARIENVSVAGPAGPIPVRVYTPAGSGPFPALVFFHGGGWVVGDLETVDRPLRALTNAAGCVVVSVDYRLAPEHRFPAAPEDCYAATCQVVERAAEWNLDPNCVSVGGDSAGGNLAAVVALMARDRGGPRIAFQLLIYPVIDHSFETASYRDCADGYVLTRAGMQWFWDHYLADPADGRHPYASPLRAEDLRGLPPALVQTAEFDPLRDEGEAYAARLREAGVPVRCTRYEGTVHGIFQMGGELEQGRRAIAEAAAALREACTG